MQIADFNPDDFQSEAQSKMDEGLLVKFYIKPIQNSAATAEQGKPVFKDAEYIEIRTPGQKNYVARPVKPADLTRFPRHYKAYKDRTSDNELIEGTLLREWPMITRSQVEELSFANVKTVEQLIAMPDSNASQFMGMNMLKAKAKTWLKRATEDKAKSDLEEALAKRDGEIEELKAAVAALQAKPKVTRKKRARKKATAKKE